MTEQTVNWQEPVALATLRRIHLRQGLRQRLDTGIGVLVVLLIALLNPTWRGWLLGGVALILLLVVLGLTLMHIRLGQVASASGPTTFRLDDQTLYASNALGDFRIPRSQIKRLSRDPEGLIVEYTAGSSFTLPNGPLKDALLAPAKGETP